MVVPKVAAVVCNGVGFQLPSAISGRGNALCRGPSLTLRVGMGCVTGAFSVFSVAFDCCSFFRVYFFSPESAEEGFSRRHQDTEMRCGSSICLSSCQCTVQSIPFVAGLFVLSILSIPPSKRMGVSLVSSQRLDWGPSLTLRVGMGWDRGCLLCSLCCLLFQFFCSCSSSCRSCHPVH